MKYAAELELNSTHVIICMKGEFIERKIAAFTIEISWTIKIACNPRKEMLNEWTPADVSIILHLGRNSFYWKLSFILVERTKLVKKRNEELLRECEKKGPESEHPNKQIMQFLRCGKDLLSMMLWCLVFKRGSFLMKMKFVLLLKD